MPNKRYNGKAMDNHFESLYPLETMKDECAKTFALIQAGGFVQAVGIPGVGKSTLLRLFAYNSGVRSFHLKDQATLYHFVYMNFSEVKQRELGDVTKFMLLSLISSLRERELFDEVEYINEKLAWALPLKDEMVFFQALRESIEYLSSVRGYRIVFLIDRLGSYFPNITEQFFINLRVLRNAAKFSFSVVFSLGRPIDMVLGEVTREIDDVLLGNTVFVGISHPAGIEFRMKHLEREVGKSCDENVKKELIRLTAGHGKLVKNGYEALLLDGANGDMEEFLLGRRQIQNCLFEIWNYFTVEEQQVLIGDGLGAQPKEGHLIKFLSSLGIIVDDKVSIPLFATYIVSQKKVLSDLTYDPEKKVILRGGRDISEMFSSSEYRLLVALLARRGQVVSRDELIEAVWGDLASLEGVTPQAFDQLVYRVRKKIEADAEAPNIIETIKGRGVRISESA